uniref:mitogen-activated protein kinase kinase kinase n=1 Tax=Acrobeloides nanus TaxID=290746 RepID=A0A914C486_9BILA
MFASKGSSVVVLSPTKPSYQEEEHQENRPPTSSGVVNNGYKSMKQGYESLANLSKSKMTPSTVVPARILKSEEKFCIEREVKNDHEKFQEWDQQKQGLSYIGTTAYEYEASGKDEISFEKGRVVEVMQINCKVKDFVCAEIEGKRGIIPKDSVNIIGIAGRHIDPKLLEKGRLIGEGGFSSVYRANYSGREVAMKMPKTVNRTSQKIRDALKQEAAFLNIFKHPNIVEFFGIYLDDPLCILLELCEGQTLKRLSKEAKNVPTKTIAIWAMQVANGMKFMHSQTPPVLHQDLKADNILVKEIPCLCGQDSELSKSIRGNYNISGKCKICYGVRLDKLKLKIADMGLARTLSTDKQSLSGSTPWMAPEYITNNIMTTKSEIWSFGVFIWELLTKAIPYKGENPYVLLYEIRPSFDRLMELLEHARDILKPDHQIILDTTKPLHEKKKYDERELLNYINSRYIGMKNLLMGEILEVLPVNRDEKDEKHIGKFDPGPSKTSPIVQRNETKYLEETRKILKNPKYDSSTWPKAKVETTLFKNRGSEDDLKARNINISAPNLQDLFKSNDPTVAEFSNTNLLSLERGTSISSSISTSPKLDKNLVMLSSNLPDSVHVETFQQMPKSSVQLEPILVTTHQEGKILIQNRSYVPVKNGTYEQQKKQNKLNQTPLAQNSNCLVPSLRKTSTTRRPLPSLPIPTLGLISFPAVLSISAYMQDLKPPPLPSKKIRMGMLEHPVD